MTQPPTPHAWQVGETAWLMQRTYSEKKGYHCVPCPHEVSVAKDGYLIGREKSNKP